MAEFQSIDTLIASYKETMQLMQEKLRFEFKNIISKIFEQAPALNAIVWIQYTPYFNDGEQCLFNVHSPNFTNAEKEEDLDCIYWGEYSGDNKSIMCLNGDENLKYFNDKELEFAKKIKFEDCIKLSDIMTSNEMENVMLSMFGNHVRVIATRNGFAISEFDHD